MGGLASRTALDYGLGGGGVVSGASNNSYYSGVKSPSNNLSYSGIASSSKSYNTYTSSSVSMVESASGFLS